MVQIQKCTNIEMCKSGTYRKMLVSHMSVRSVCSSRHIWNPFLWSMLRCQEYHVLHARTQFCNLLPHPVARCLHMFSSYIISFEHAVQEMHIIDNRTQPTSWQQCNGANSEMYKYRNVQIRNIPQDAGIAHVFASGLFLSSHFESAPKLHVTVPGVPCAPRQHSVLQFVAAPCCQVPSYFQFVYY